MTQATFNRSLRAAAQKLEQEAQALRWRDDPVAWAEEKMGLVLWSKQKEVLRSVAKNKRTAVKSCHSIGKTFLSAVVSSWWVDTRENCMVQSTAPTYHQVHAQLWEEIRKMHLRANLPGRVTLGDQWLKPILNVESGRTSDTLVGEGKKPADGNIHGFHGIHRPDGVLALLDEGCGIARALFTGAEAITTASFDRTLTTGNPDDPNTEFGDIFQKNEGKPNALWNCITVSAFDTPNFTGEGDELRRKYKNDPAKLAWVEALLEGMPQPETVEQQKQLWGEDSPRYLSKVLAVFPRTSVDSLFSASDIEKGLAEVIEPDEHAFRVMAVDVARYGGDASVMVTNVAGHVEVVDSLQSLDTMEVAARVHKQAIDLRIDQVRVDGVGVGGGVVDRLIQLTRAAGMPYVVVEMIASASPPDRTLHRNARAYWYDSAKYQLRSANIDLPKGGSETLAEKLELELGTIKYAYPNGIMQIESKEDIRRRGDKSPDFVDAFVMAIAPINYMLEGPLANMRPGQMLEIDVLERIDMVSPY